ncbi:MAG TPA: nitrate reductase molybdenum cofactor assembly chaperone, partial [Gaiellaceae bacterium]
ASQLELAQAYVETFDLRRRTSLYLTYYLHGDTRKRGMALLRLKRLYAQAGLELAREELPDYLPLVLEFAALAPGDAGETLLREHRPELELLRANLHDAGSPYADVLEALCAGLPRLTPIERERIRRLGSEGPPSEQVGLQPFAPPEVMPTEVRV